MDEFPLTRAAAARMFLRGQVGSTNADLRELAAEGLAAWTVVMTDDQTSGRGRRGRTWTLPPGAGLAISVLVPGGVNVGLGWYPLAAGLAMAEAVAEVLPTRPVGVKWPNDVLVGEKKICGILAELLPSGEVIIGAGVNDRMEVGQLPTSTATSLAVESAVGRGDIVVARFLERLRGLIEDLGAAAGDADASGLRNAVIDRCVTLGRSINVELSSGRELSGFAGGIDASGRLIVRDGDGVAIPVSAGDVVHVR